MVNASDEKWERDEAAGAYGNDIIKIKYRPKPSLTYSADILLKHALASKDKDNPRQIGSLFVYIIDKLGIYMYGYAINEA